MSIGNSRKHQRGATAIEFAFVFPVFFMLFYGCLMYGLIFFIRMGLQHSAEDGARAALRYQVTNPPLGSTAAQQRQLQMQARLAWARSVAAAQAGWMNGWHPPEVSANICLVEAECLTTPVPAIFPDCNATTRCQIVVTVRYPYATNPVIPALPGLGLLAPASIEGRARVLLDGRALSS